ncbi:hypothetical protein Q3G72_007403 [Acer saccharum]|nr:hypothetical protein Q3G72_007403 [Acer saccharum]
MYLAMYANLPIWEVIISPMELALQVLEQLFLLKLIRRRNLNIRIQLGYLKEVANLLKEELGDTEAKNILENAIYLSSFVGVDYMAFINNTYTYFTQSKMEEYVKMVLGNLTEVTKANFRPYGETFFKYPSGRFCDGRNIPDFTALHANLSLWRPYLYDQSGKHQFLNGASFASAGAPVLSYVNPKVETITSSMSPLNTEQISHLTGKPSSSIQLEKILRWSSYPRFRCSSCKHITLETIFRSAWKTSVLGWLSGTTTAEHYNKKGLKSPNDNDHTVIAKQALLTTKA